MLSFSKRAALILSGTLFVVFASVWLASPFIAKRVINEQLKPFNLQLGTHSEIRLNLIRASIKITDLSLLKQQSVTFTLKHAEVSLSPAAILGKQLKIKSLNLTALSTDVQLSENSLIVAGIDIHQLSSSSSQPQQTQTEPANNNWQLVVDNVSLNDIEINLDYLGQPLKTGIEQLSLQDIEVRDDYLGLQGSLAAFVNTSIMKTDFDLVLNNNQLEANATNSIKADLGLASAFTNELPIDELAGHISIDNSFSASYELASQSLDLHVREHKMVIKALAADYEGIETSLETLTHTIEQAAVAVKLDEPQSLSATLVQNVELSELNSRYQGQVLLSLQNLDAAPINTSVEGQDWLVTTDNIHLTTLLASEKTDTPLLAVEDIELQQISLQPKAFKIGDIAINAATLSATINEKQQLLELVDVSSLAQSTQLTDEQKEIVPATPENHAPSIEISSLHIDPSSTINLHFDTEDSSFEQLWMFDKFLVSNINLAPTLTEATFDLHLKEGEFSSISANGGVQLSPHEQNMTINGDITELALPPYSAFIEQFMGLEISSGQLYQTLELNVINGEIDGTSDIKLHSLKLDNSEFVDAKALSKGTAMSLNAALNVLKDKRDNIALTVPLKGDINSPKFGVQSFINIVVKKAAVSSAKRYVINTFVPYANIVKIANIAGSEIFKLRFKPLVYDASQIELSESQQVYVSELAALLQANPKESLTICPVVAAVEIEEAAPYKRAQTTAQKRANNLKSALVNQHQIASARLALCNTEIDEGKEAKTRLTFSFK